MASNLAWQRRQRQQRQQRGLCIHCGVPRDGTSVQLCVQCFVRKRACTNARRARLRSGVRDDRDPEWRRERARKAGLAAKRAHQRRTLARVQGLPSKAAAYQRGYVTGYRRAYAYWHHQVRWWIQQGSRQTRMAARSHPDE